jgi:heptosyltransferase II
MGQTDCRFFNGYKPCGLSSDCHQKCAHYQKVQSHILIIHLGALGAVLRSTGLLKAIKRKYPLSHITWVTDAPADAMLRKHSAVDRVLTTRFEDILSLSALEFDIAFVIDKSLKAKGILKQTNTDLIFGFTTESKTGAIVPATAAAHELWQVGLSNEIKFFKNKKTELQLVAESLELEWKRDSYWYEMSQSEKDLVAEKRALWSSFGQKKLIGLNTGCSDVMPAKKMTVDFYRRLIQRLKLDPDLAIVLLGGPEDQVRNQKISYGLDCFVSSTNKGLREGYTSVAACDVVFSGDSLGMHMAIAAQVYTIAWFGPTCAHEIDFFNYGEALLTQATCSPCWKRTCSEATMCYDLVDLDKVETAIQRGIARCEQKHKSLSKQHSLEI